MSISDKQLDRFRERLQFDMEWADGKGNNRRVQPMHERKLWMRGSSYYDDEKEKHDMDKDWADTINDHMDSLFESASYGVALGAAAVSAVAALSF